MSLHESQIVNSPVTPQSAALELLRRREARRSMLAFTEYVRPAYQTNWHHRVICDALDRFVEGEIKRLMLFVPPQHGKSELVSRHLPAYMFGRNPDLKVTAASYAAELIQGMNRDVQRIMESDAYSRLFPDTSLNSKNIRTVAGSYLRNNDVFEVVGRRGAYRCAGVGGGLTGFPSDVGILDDAYKDQAEASSHARRETVWEWYTSVFLNRTHKDSRLLLTFTRWHEDDLAGRLLQLEPDAWTVISLPAVCEYTTEEPQPEYDPRVEGEALWPDRHPVESLEQKRNLNPRQFESTHQQRPKAREGNMFKLLGLPVQNKDGVAFVAPKGEGVKRYRYWDLGGSDSSKADYSVGVLMSRTPEGIFYVEDVERGQWSPKERNERIRATAEADQIRGGVDENGNPLQPITTWIEKVPGLAVEVINNIVQHMAGLPVKTEMAKNDKVTRADPFADQCEAGNVRVVKADWNKAYREELTAFPNGKNDDQVDGSSGAFSKLAPTARRSVTV